MAEVAMSAAQARATIVGLNPVDTPVVAEGHNVADPVVDRDLRVAVDQLPTAA